MDPAAEREPRRLLFLAYEFPPSAGGGVQRVAKLAKYLRREGWEPVVIAAEPLPGKPMDDTLLREIEGIEVLRLPARNLTVAIARAVRHLKRGVRSQASGAPAHPGAQASPARPGRSPLSTVVARWLMVPDAAVPWSRSAARLARAMHAERPFDAVFASGPPYSALVAAGRIGKSLGIPVLLDMRDAWRDNIAGLFPTPLHRALALRLERRALRDASAVVAVSDGVAEEARDLGAREVHVVPNGFDPTDVPPWEPEPGAPLTVAFLGRFNQVIADPETFFAGWAAAVDDENALQDAHLVVVGPDAPWVSERAARYGLAGNVSFLGFKPYAEAVAIVARADAGLVLFADRPGSEAIYSGKLFDYLGIGLPILLVGPKHGVAAALIREARAGETAQDGDEGEVAGAMRSLARAKAAGRPWASADPAVAARFDRRRQAALVAGILEDIVERGHSRAIRALP